MGPLNLLPNTKQGTYVFKASTIDELNLALTEIREFISSVTNIYTTVSSIIPIVSRQTGTIDGVVNVNITDTPKIATSSTQTESKGTLSITTPMNFTLNSTVVEYLLTYDISAKEDL